MPVVSSQSRFAANLALTPAGAGPAQQPVGGVFRGSSESVLDLGTPPDPAGSLGSPRCRRSRGARRSWRGGRQAPRRAPCTAMVFVWSYLTDADPAYARRRFSAAVSASLFGSRSCRSSGRPDADGRQAPCHPVRSADGIPRPGRPMVSRDAHGGCRRRLLRAYVPGHRGRVAVSVGGVGVRRDGYGRARRAPDPFTALEVRACLRVPAGANEDQARRLLARAEETCLVTNSLKVRPHLDAVVEVEAEGSSAANRQLTGRANYPAAVTGASPRCPLAIERVAAPVCHPFVTRVVKPALPSNGVCDDAPQRLTGRVPSGRPAGLRLLGETGKVARPPCTRFR